MMPDLMKSLEKRRSLLEQIVSENCEANGPKECVERLLEGIEKDMRKGRRQPAPPPPEGGISVRAASRKYGIPTSTISDWINKAKILNILSKTKNKTYILEDDILQLAALHREFKGHGKRSIVKKIRENN